MRRLNTISINYHNIIRVKMWYRPECSNRGISAPTEAQLFSLFCQLTCALGLHADSAEAAAVAATGVAAAAVVGVVAVSVQDRPLYCQWNNWSFLFAVTYLKAYTLNCLCSRNKVRGAENMASLQKNWGPLLNGPWNCKNLMFLLEAMITKYSFISGDSDWVYGNTC